VNEELCKELRDGVVGVLSREKDVKRIQTTLFMEGYRSISVTHMGGNMVILRSPVVGDVDRLLRSKNECLKYYFSALKPWNPGLLASQREVWVHIYGIPLHIWGETFFKLIGNRMGVFLDFDEETARADRFDVARIKVLSSTWSSIDMEFKVEVEGAFFDVWVVEEMGRQRPVMVVGGRAVDDGSFVVPSEASDEVDDGGGGGGEELSGEDEDSGDEVDGNVRRKQVQHGGDIEVNKDSNMCLQQPNEEYNILTIDKSTENIILVKEILPVPLVSVAKEVGEMGQMEPVKILVELQKGASDNCDASGTQASGVRSLEGDGIGGTQGSGEREGVGDVDGGPHLPMEVTVVEAGQNLNPPEPLISGQHLVGWATINSGPLEEEGNQRYSSLSEPEEVFSNNVCDLKIPPKLKKHKSCSKINKLGIPKCLQLTEALKEAGPRGRRRRAKGVSGVMEDKGKLGAEVRSAAVGSDGAATGFIVNDKHRQKNPGSLEGQSVTPATGIGLILESENSQSASSQQDSVGEKEKAIEAARLLSIQKEVGFTFEEQDDEIVQQLVNQETKDRGMKMEWEKKEGHQ
jgi:hypothetical protein